MHSSKTHLALSLILAVAGILLPSPTSLAAPPPKNESHPCTVTVGDRFGDSILSDGGGIYTDGLNADVRLWDMKNGVADHLFFQAAGTRKVRLSIPGVTNGIQTCSTATFKPNVNASGYQFYNDLPVGSSTADIGQNFGGTIGCSFGTAGRTPST